MHGAQKAAATATAALEVAEKELSGLATAIPKAEMEAHAARETASDLQARLAQLTQAAQVGQTALSVRIV